MKFPNSSPYDTKNPPSHVFAHTRENVFAYEREKGIGVDGIGLPGGVREGLGE